MKERKKVTDQGYYCAEMDIELSIYIERMSTMIDIFLKQ